MTETLLNEGRDQLWGSYSTLALPAVDTVTGDVGY